MNDASIKAGGGLEAATDAAPILETDNLRRVFGPIVAVDGIDLSVRPGEVLGFLGPNGAGKSTMMKMIAGFLPPTGGTARICGFDVTTAPLSAKRRLGYLPEGAPAYPDMTPRTFLRFAAGVRGLSGARRRAALDEAVAATNLERVLHQPIETLSKGFKRRVGLAQAILHDPDVLILDEPTDGLDPNQKHEMRSLIQRLSPDKAIIISTHILEEVNAVCTRAAIIARGRIVADGAPHDLEARSPHHGAVTVALRTIEAADAASGVLTGLVGVAGVESPEPKRLTVLAKPGVAIGEKVRGALAKANIGYDELFVEPGRLDEVFRAVTAEGAAA